MQFFYLVLTTCVTLLGACATSSPLPVDHAEAVRRENAVTVELSQQLEEKLKFNGDKDVLIYLRSLAHHLAQGSEELGTAPLGVWVVRDRAGVWNSYALPGARLYLSGGLLHVLDSENEVAAVIALQLGHLARHHVQEQLVKSLDDDPAQPGNLSGLLPLGAVEKIKRVDYFGPDGLFAFPEAAQLEAIDTAVDLLYKAGYDSRGLITVWQHLGAEGVHSSFDKGTLDKFIEYARSAISRYSPLRNPVIRSAAFLAIEKRIRRL